MSDDHILVPRRLPLPECELNCPERERYLLDGTERRRRCDKCRNRQMNRRQEEKIRRCWTYRLIKRARCNRIGRGRIHDRTNLDHGYLIELYEQQGRCCWTGAPLGLEFAYAPWSISLDRLDIRAGYVIKNVVLASLAANCGRQRASAEEMIPFVRKIREAP